MISIEDTEKPDSNWNKRLTDAKIGTTNQTIERGINFERQGQIPRYLKFINKNGKICGQLLYSISSRLEKKGFLGKSFKKIPGLNFPLYFWIYGPIIFDNNYYSEIMNELRSFLISKKCKVYGTTNPLLFNDESILEKNFKITKWSTYLLDLHKSSNELFENISKHNGRKNIKRSIKRGVTIHEITEESFSEYYELRSKFQEKLGEKITNFEHAIGYWKLMKPLGFSGFVAKKDGIPIGGMMFHYFNKVIVEAGVARSDIDYEEKLYSQDLIKWKVIEWGIKNDMDYYDLAGFNPTPQSDKERGIVKYKSKWGGQVNPYWIIRL